MTRAWTIATTITCALGLSACSGSGGLKADGGGGSAGSPGFGGSGGANPGTGGATGGAGGRGGAGGATGGSGGAIGGSGGRGGMGGATGGTGGAVGGSGGRGGGTGGATGGTGGGRDAGLDFDALASAPPCPANPQGQMCNPMAAPSCQLPGDTGLLNRCVCLMQQWQCANQGGGGDGGLPPISQCPANASGMPCPMANAICMSGNMGGCLCRAASQGGALSWVCRGS